jgi:hypothetical protein
MLGFEKVPCIFCDRPVARKEALRLRDRKDVVVCVRCRDHWLENGRKCAACQSVVHGAQDVGVFLDRHAFGHADCGGLQIAR